MATVSLKSQADAVRTAASRARTIGRELGYRSSQTDLLRAHLEAAAQTLADLAHAEAAVGERRR